MTRDPRDKRLKDIQRRFRRVHFRLDSAAEYRRTVRNPTTWVLAFVVFAATLALLLVMLRL